MDLKLNDNETMYLKDIMEDEKEALEEERKKNPNDEKECASIDEDLECCEGILGKCSEDE